MCTECEQKNPIEKTIEVLYICIRRSVTLYAECERYTGYLMNKAFVHLRTRGSIMANDVRSEAIEDRLLRRRQRDKIEEREKPVKKDAQGLLNSACITHFSHLAY